MNLLNLFNTLCTDNDVKTLDFTKKEDLDKLTEAVNVLKDENNSLVKFARTMLGDDIDELLDTVLSEAQKKYDEAHPTVAPKRVVIDKSLKETKTPEKPSSKVAEELQHKFDELATEYVEKIIVPTGSFTDEQLTSVKNGLFEFACWIYTR